MLVPRLYVRRTESDFIALFNRIAELRAERQAVYDRLRLIVTLNKPGSGTDTEREEALVTLLDHARDTSLQRHTLSRQQSLAATLLISKPDVCAILGKSDGTIITEPLQAEDAMEAAEQTLLNAGKNAFACG